jgi:predicted RNA polymerase sigma factor
VLPPGADAASAIALTLRAVGGLTHARDRRAFLVPEATMAQRISRAKQTIRARRAVPAADGDERPSGCARCCTCSTWSSTRATRPARPDVHRADLRRGDPADPHGARLLPDDAEVAGLLALMLLLDARRAGPHRPSGELSRWPSRTARWDRRSIAEGAAMLAAAIGEARSAIPAAGGDRRRARPGRRAEDTDWPQILALYELLERMTGNPVVTLNRAVAAAMVHGRRPG